MVKPIITRVLGTDAKRVKTAKQVNKWILQKHAVTLSPMKITRSGWGEHSVYTSNESVCVHNTARLKVICKKRSWQWTNSCQYDLMKVIPYTHITIIIIIVTPKISTTTIIIISIKRRRRRRRLLLNLKKPIDQFPQGGKRNLDASNKKKKKKSAKFWM